jgi:hypothetical protein
VKGYLSKHSNPSYSVKTLNQAGVFSTSVFTSGLTTDLNLLDVNDGNHFLAGLIKPGKELGNGIGNDRAALLGNSFATNPGSSPQPNKDPSKSNTDSETAIWSYDFISNALTATWVNYPGQVPSATTTHIYSIDSGEKLLLTDSATPPPNGVAVVFKYISVEDQCDNLR